LEYESESGAHRDCRHKVDALGNESESVTGIRDQRSL